MEIEPRTHATLSQELFHRAIKANIDSSFYPTITLLFTLHLLPSAIAWTPYLWNFWTSENVGMNSKLPCFDHVYPSLGWPLLFCVQPWLLKFWISHESSLYSVEWPPFLGLRMNCYTLSFVVPFCLLKITYIISKYINLTSVMHGWYHKNLRN